MPELNAEYSRPLLVKHNTEGMGITELLYQKAKKGEGREWREACPEQHRTQDRNGSRSAHTYTQIN